MESKKGVKEPFTLLFKRKDTPKKGKKQTIMFFLLFLFAKY